MIKFVSFVLAVLLLGAVPATAQNTVDYSSLTSAVNFSSAISAMMSVAAVVALVYVAWKGIKFVISAMRGF